MVPANQTIASRYKVLRELGRGGMGAVYLVEHVHTGERLALKVLLSHAGALPEVIERFKREARAPAQIRSEHVVRVTDADVAPELGGAPFLVMEALEGSDLEKLHEQRGKFSPEELMWMLRQVAVALDKAHSIGIVHRDLKPENIFLHKREDGSSIVKILDFGISKTMRVEGGDMASAGLTRTGAVMGTPLYMSPEQARGRASAIGPATDVWAMGLIAINLLSGQQYWDVETMADLHIKILVEPLAAPSVRFPELGTRLDPWFFRSCDRDPAQRWPTVGEQIHALGVALNVPVSMRPPPSKTFRDVGIGAYTPPSPQAPARTTGEHPMGLSTAGAAAVTSPATTTSKGKAPIVAGLGIAGVMLLIVAFGAFKLVTVVRHQATREPPPVAPSVVASPPPSASVAVSTPPPPASSAPPPAVAASVTATEPTVSVAHATKRPSSPSGKPAAPASAKPSSTERFAPVAP